MMITSGRNFSYFDGSLSPLSLAVRAICCTCARKVSGWIELVPNTVVVCAKQIGRRGKRWEDFLGKNEGHIRSCEIK